MSQPLRAEHKSTLEVGEIKDTRSVKDKFVLIHKQNAYGKTTGAYVTKEPMAGIVRAGLVQALQRNGFVGSNATKYELRGDIQEFGFDSIAGFWKATVKPKLTFRFELIDKVSGQSVWHDTYIGRDTAETAWGSKELLVELFVKVCDDVVQELISDKNFRSFFE